MFQMTSNKKTAHKKKAKHSVKYPGLEGKAPWTLEAADIIERLDSDSEEGLQQKEASQRRQYYGPNRIKFKKRRSAFRILLDQFKNLIIFLLIAAASVSYAFEQLLEGTAIVVAMLVNVIIGFGTELRAVRSMEALQKMTRVETKILRRGKIKKVPAMDLVPGDIVFLDSGDMVPADLRLIEANRMQADESALTGESVPVDKSTDVLSGDVPLAERSNMVFKGTAMTHGSGKGVVASTGMSTELGNISKMAQEAETEALTPLEKRLNKLGQNLVWFTLGIAALVGLTGYLAELNVFLIFKTAVALAVAAIPEGLPIVATIALARGMWRMAEKNALVNKLSSVETLGATSIICADKTGTLTENKMTVKSLTLPEFENTKTIDFDHDLESSFIQNGDIEKDEATKQRIEDILTVGVLCNNAQISEDDQGVGDPMELALLQAGLAAGLKREVLIENNPEEKEVAFSTETKMMATWHRTDQGNYLAAVKGAPEAVTKACTRFLSGESREQDFDESLQKKMLEANHDLAGKGLRMLAVARKLNDTVEDDNMRDFGSNPLLNDVTRNIFVWGAVFLSIALLLLAVYFPPLARVLSMVPPTTDEWGLILGTSLAFFLLVQILKQFSSFDPLKRKPVSD